MAVFTGCLPTKTGVYQNEPFWEHPFRRKTLLEFLKIDGYQLFGAGKVFHGAFDYLSAGQQRTRSASWKEIENRIEHWDGFTTMPSEPLPEGRPLNSLFDYGSPDMSHWNWNLDWGVLPDDRENEMPDNRTVEAVELFLSDEHERPFFCAAGLYKPHLPWYVPKRFFEPYPLERISLPLVKVNDLDDVPHIAREWARTPDDHSTILAKGQWRYAVQAYLAAITYCDSMIGRILDAVDKSPARDNTVIALWGDNGFHLGEKLHWRKFVLWEEATRVPMIIAPSKSAEPTVATIDGPVGLVDLLPTLFDLCGVPLPKNLDGKSLKGEMLGLDKNSNHFAVTAWLKGNYSIRMGSWRYTRYVDRTEELYNHDSDPYEWKNLANNARFKEVVAKLSMLMPADRA